MQILDFTMIFMKQIFCDFFSTPLSPFPFLSPHTLVASCTSLVSYWPFNCDPCPPPTNTSTLAYLVSGPPTLSHVLIYYVHTNIPIRSHIWERTHDFYVSKSGSTECNWKRQKFLIKICSYTKETWKINN